jgi:endonuclease YncB( thermonuclease family)
MALSRRSRRAQRRKPRSFVRRFLDLALAVAILAALAFVAGHERFGTAETRSGMPQVVDGDSLTFGGTRLRLIGIDAPELGQTCAGPRGDYACGREARNALAEMIGGRPVTCEAWRRDRYDRLLASCKAGGVDLNRAMVERGWAVAYGDHDDAEQSARAAGRGLWAGSFERPQDWRRIHGGMAEVSHDGLSAIGDWLRSLFQGNMSGQETDGGETG